MLISRPRMLLTAALLAAGALAAGCGGDGDSKPKQDAVTRPQYIEQVDAVCRRTSQQSKPTNRRLQALVTASGTYSSRLKKAAPLLRMTYDLQKAKLDRIKAITPPQKDRAQIAAIVKTSAATLAEFKGAIPIAERGDLKSFIDIAFDANGTRAKAERLGTTYGLRAECFAVPIDLSSL